MSVRDSLKLYVLGHPGADLFTLAEFRNGRGLTRSPLSESQAKALNQRIRALRRFVETGSPLFSTEDLRLLGTELFGLIFTGPVLRLLDAAHGSIAGSYLPIELFVEDFALSGWPWEFLYDPAQGKFICRGALPLCRGVFCSTPSGMVYGASTDICILVFVASRDKRLAVDNELRHLDSVFRRKLVGQQVHADVVEGDPEQLPQVLRQQRYDILHFIGHAAFDEGRKEGYLRFDRASGPPMQFYAEDLAELLSKHPIRLVFFNACETARSAGDATPESSSLAAALLGRGVPAVIGMQYSMPANNGPLFAAQVYLSMRQGLSLIDAVRSARTTMPIAADARYFDWGIPVLYTTDPQVVLFPVAATTMSVDSSVHAPSSQREPGDQLEAVLAPVVRSSLRPGLESLPAIGHVHSSAVQAARPRRVVIVDLDARVGALPDLLEACNRVQRYYFFQADFLALPSGAVRSLGKASQERQLYLPWVEGYFFDELARLEVDLVCCLTCHPIAGADETGTFANHFSASLPGDERVSFVSTHDLSRYALKASVSVAFATLWLCLSEILVKDERWRLDYHDDTVGCLMDYCNFRPDLKKGLRRGRFDHAACRKKISDVEQLQAIDALLALGRPNS